MDKDALRINSLVKAGVRAYLGTPEGKQLLREAVKVIAEKPTPAKKKPEKAVPKKKETAVSKKKPEKAVKK